MNNAKRLRSILLVGGLALSAARELPQARISILDLSQAELAADLAALARQVLSFSQTEPARTLALRQEQLWERSLDPASPAPADVAVTFRIGGAYAIVGGAGGLGLALATYLAGTYKARLLLIGRSPLSASQSRAIAAINGSGGTAMYVTADAADRQQLENALAEGRARFGRFDGAIQAAMVLNDMSFSKLDEGALTSVLRPKIDATYHLVSALQPDKPDMVLLFSSANAFIGNPGQANYSASKAGLIGMTRTVAKELAGRKVTVNAVAPGVITTPFHERFSTPQMLEGFRATIPMNRLGTAEECAGAFVYLASEQMSGYVTGQIIEVNGGQYMP